MGPWSMARESSRSREPDPADVASGWSPSGRIRFEVPPHPRRRWDGCTCSSLLLEGHSLGAAVDCSVGRLKLGEADRSAATEAKAEDGRVEPATGRSRPPRTESESGLICSRSD